MSIKICWLSPFPSLFLSFCICKMGMAHPQRARWSPWGQPEDSHGMETAGLSPLVALQAGCKGAFTHSPPEARLVDPAWGSAASLGL